VGRSQAANGRLARQLQDILEEAGQPVPTELRQYAAVTGGGGGGGGACCPHCPEHVVAACVECRCCVPCGTDTASDDTVLVTLALFMAADTPAHLYCPQQSQNATGE